MPQIGPLEIVMVLVVALIVFGPKKLPGIGKQAAQGLREFRRFQSGLRDELQGMLDADDDADAPARTETRPEPGAETRGETRGETDGTRTTEAPGADPGTDSPPADTTQ